MGGPMVSSASIADDPWSLGRPVPAVPAFGEALRDGAATQRLGERLHAQRNASPNAGNRLLGTVGCGVAKECFVSIFLDFFGKSSVYIIVWPQTGF